MSTLSVLFVIVARVVCLHCQCCSSQCSMSTLSMLFVIVARVCCLRYQCCSSYWIVYVVYVIIVVRHNYSGPCICLMSNLSVSFANNGDGASRELFGY